MGVIKLDIDGSSLRTQAELALEGLIKDCYGNWMIGFTSFTSYGSN
jgi:hypothetical protein